jgi:hypothetical protein
LRIIKNLFFWETKTIKCASKSLLAIEFKDRAPG